MYILNGILVIASIAVLGYYFHGLKCTIQYLWAMRRNRLIILLAAETLLLLSIFGIADYPNDHGRLWWAVVTLLVVRGISMHMKQPTPQADLFDSPSRIDFTA